MAQIVFHVTPICKTVFIWEATFHHFICCYFCSMMVCVCTIWCVFAATSYKANVIMLYVFGNIRLGSQGEGGDLSWCIQTLPCLRFLFCLHYICDSSCYDQNTLLMEYMWIPLNKDTRVATHSDTIVILWVFTPLYQEKGCTNIAIFSEKMVVCVVVCEVYQHNSLHKNWKSRFLHVSINSLEDVTL